MHVIFFYLSRTCNYWRGLDLLSLVHECFFLVHLLDLHLLLSWCLQRIKGLERFVLPGSYILDLKVRWRRLRCLLRWDYENICEIIWKSLGTISVIVLRWFKGDVCSPHNCFRFSLWSKLATFNNQFLASSIAVVIKLYILIIIGIYRIRMSSYPNVLSFVIYKFVS